MTRIISPSMLSADFGNLERDTKMIDRSAAEWVHIDVMDGVFVTQLKRVSPGRKTRPFSKDSFPVVGSEISIYPSFFTSSRGLFFLPMTYSAENLYTVV